MKEIANMLGVELNEEFGVTVADGTTIRVKITADNMYVRNSSNSFVVYDLTAMLRTLMSINNITKLNPQNFSYNDKYYSVGPGGVLEPGTWMNDFIDQALYKLGNCYRTVEEAEVNRDKWIKFYSTNKSVQVD